MADVLARETASDDVDLDSVCSQSLCCEFADVIIDVDTWPSATQHLLAIGISLAEGRSVHTASFKPCCKSADTAEEIKDIQSLTHSLAGVSSAST
jgi:hypothetical protein